jgi:hypothetical protein
MKSVLATIGIVTALILGVVNYGKPINVNVPASNPTPVQVNVPAQERPVVNVSPTPVNVSVPKQENAKLGAVSGPDIYSPYFNVNDVYRWPVRQSFNQATTTICSILSPYATSTLESFTVQFSVASATVATIVDIAKSSNTGATTTKIGSTYAINAGAQATIEASTTPGAGDLTIIAPNQYIVVNMKGGLTNIFSPLGNCSATFKTTN